MHIRRASVRVAHRGSSKSTPSTSITASSTRDFDHGGRVGPTVRNAALVQRPPVGPTVQQESEQSANAIPSHGRSTDAEQCPASASLPGTDPTVGARQPSILTTSAGDPVQLHSVQMTVGPSSSVVVTTAGSISLGEQLAFGQDHLVGIAGPYLHAVVAGRRHGKGTTT